MRQEVKVSIDLKQLHRATVRLASQLCGTHKDLVVLPALDQAAG